MNKPRYIYIDFEFNQTSEENVNLVCCALSDSQTNKKESFWLHNDQSEKDRLRSYLIDKKDVCVFQSWSVVAEARCFYALGLNPSEFTWIDQFLEYRCLLNHSDLQFGKHLIDGKVHRNPASPFDKRFKKPEDNLGAALYKLLNVKIDTQHKEFMRDVIIDGRYVEKYKDDILNYCISDIDYLPDAFRAIVDIYKQRLNKSNLMSLRDEMFRRSDYAARTAIMESVGYPINIEATRNFSKSVQDILNDVASDINEQFPDLMPFERNRANRRYVFKQDKAREQVDRYCRQNNITNWPRSEKTGEYSLAVDAYSKFFQYRHDFPRGNYFAQVLRYKKTDQHMNGFKPKAKPINCWEGTDILKNKDKANKMRRTFFDSVGSDGRSRPYFNIFGSQSSRSQPPATFYLPLKAAWMRSFIEPRPGRSIIGIDFGQQEFLLKGLMANDKEMLKAYESGDVYLYFGKKTGGIPKDATKEHPLRDKYKSTTLGIQFLMTKFGLSIKLTNDTGEFHSEDDAQDLIDQFNDLYEVAAEHSNELVEEYHEKGYVKLPCGYYMWGRNPNDRSVANCPVQGFGASIMRKAVELAQDRGLTVIYTLHDQLNIECDLKHIERDTCILAECMDEAFRFYMPKSLKKKANIRLDADIWGPDLEVEKYSFYYNTICGKKELPVKQQKIYIDKRSATEYERFKKYFVNRYHTELL